MTVWQTGPYLLLDRSMVAETTNLYRSVQPPSRLPDPIITGVEDGNFQPYMTVVQDALTRRFRIWYNTPCAAGSAGSSSLAHMESDDGIHSLMRQDTRCLDLIGATAGQCAETASTIRSPGKDKTAVCRARRSSSSSVSGRPACSLSI